MSSRVAVGTIIGGESTKRSSGLLLYHIIMNNDYNEACLMYIL